MSYGITAPDFRLPAETHVGAVRLHVTDLARSLDFYHDLLGFALLDKSSNGAHLGVDDTALIQLQPGARAPQSGRNLGLYHFAILLPTRDALGRALKNLLDAGIRPGAADHLVSEALYIQDPDGLGIEIYRDRPAAEWHVRGGELAMASEPLDFAAVLSAGAGQEWEGMPSGTYLGHMHLHVGSIDEAKAFYHTALGLDVTVSSYPGALFMSAGGYHHHLGVNTWAGPRAQPPPADQARLLLWDLILPTADSIQFAGESLEKHGYHVNRGAGDRIVVQDPWGTALTLKTAV